ncbi:hypothetical protein N0V88_004811 [Collariella sp. IMI 366227]|nr:hypothetical protein N0V88_004811 [Collariella sp. IMI 366227]
MASATPSTPKGGRSAAVKAKSSYSLRYRKRSACVAMFYLIFLVVPWVITCVMMFRPVNKPSYKNVPGTTRYTDGDARAMQRWLHAAQVMNTIATVLALPVLSSLLAQAAVRYTQRQSSGKTLNLGQLFALADRGWADVPLLLSSARAASPLLLFGALLSLIALVQPPIRSILVYYEPRSIATCTDLDDAVYLTRDINVPALCPREPGDRVLWQRWFDPEPSDLASCPRGLIIPKVQHTLADLNAYDSQPYLWTETGLGNGSLPNDVYTAQHTDSLFYYMVYADAPKLPLPLSFYTSSLPRGTTTGALRYHALRQQSNARCETVPQSSFPSTCPGDAPFTASLSDLHMAVRVCSPGAANRSPWTGTRNRQTVNEDFWIDVELNGTAGGFTTHCTSTSSLGYFELGNRHNGNVPGPLLDAWPDRQDLVLNSHDLTGVKNKNKIPTTEAPPAGVFDLGFSYEGVSWDYLPTPGPLTTSAMALFGNTSFFSAIQAATESNYTEVLKSICSGMIPFPHSISFFNSSYSLNSSSFIGPNCAFVERGRGDVNPDSYLSNLALSFVSTFHSNRTAEAVLETAMFAANQALLTTTASHGWRFYARSIYSSPGYEIHTPIKSTAALAVVSALLLAQVVGVVALAMYSVTSPTWTHTLDALAMAKIGRDLGGGGAGLGALGVRDENGLGALAAVEEPEGVVGVRETDVD